jgi:murein L,D-transpeptidase YafK
MWLVAVALLLSQASTPAEAGVTRIVVQKNARKMTLWSGDKVLRDYRVALGGQPVGPKVRQGDHKTQEGLYQVDYKLPTSTYHRALHISYPDASDRARARKLGVDPGGDILIHGLASKYAYLGAMHRAYDWTEGCIAVTNPEIEEIYKMVPVGTPVEIRP